MLSRVSLMSLAVTLLCATGMRAEQDVFASFEREEEVSSLQVSAGVQAHQSERFPAWEKNSLEITFPQGGGSVALGRIPSDWRRQESLLAFIWSVQKDEVTLTVGDSAGAIASRKFPLRSGVNHLQWPTAEIKGIKRDGIRRVSFETAQGGTWYLDYVALDRYQPVLKERGRWDINYSMEVETPHIPWARPFTGGPLKVFAIADVTDGRGVIELAQRLQMDLRATTIGSSPGTNKWGFGDFYTQRSGGGEFWAHAYSLANTYIADDLINGPRYDVILWPGLRPWDSYPAEVRDALRRRLEEGTGLVLFYPFSRNGKADATWTPSPFARTPDIKSEDSNNFFRNGFENLDHSPWQASGSHYITRGIPFGLFPWAQMAVPACTAKGQVLLRTVSGNPVLAVQTVGKGRVAAFAYTEKGMIPEIQNVFETGLHYPYHEYLWSLVARAVVWAAGREPAPAIGDVSCSPGSIESRVAGAPKDARLSVTVRNSFGEVEFSGFAVQRSGSETLSCKLARLQGGLHIVELKLMQGGRTLDWASAELDVPAPVSIKSLKPEVDRVSAGQKVAIRLDLASAAPTAAEVRIRLYDNYDRLLDQKQMSVRLPEEARRTAELSTKGALTHLARVDCEVLAGGIRSDRRTAGIFVLQPRRWDDYDIVMYRFGPDPIPGIWPKIDEQMRRLNVTTLSSYSVNNSKHANYNVQAQTRIPGQESPDGPARNYYTAMKKKYLATGDKHVLQREYCLDDPAYRELVTKELKRLTEPWVPFSPMSYYVFEEPSLTCYSDAVDICFNPHTLASMRTWLKQVYGSVENLNRQWGTKFASWDEVEPDDTPEAQRRGNYASWADHRTYMEKAYADTFSFVFDELRKIDPEGILLNSGTQDSMSHNGCDYSRINRFTRHLNAYDGGNQLEFHRCFSPDVKISGGAGYGVLGRDVFYNFYDNLFKGSNGGAYVFWQYSTLDPDMTMSQSGKDMEKGFQEMRGEGIGKLVGLAVPDNHGIAIHYSYPSIHGTWILDGKVKEEASEHTSDALDRFNGNRDGWVRILKDSGLQFDFLAYSAVENGELLSKGYKTFVLPMSVALSDREIEAIREFVKRGGTLIVDAMPGVMNEHCTFRTARPLLDVLGITAAPGSRDALLAAEGDRNLQLTTGRNLPGRGDRAAAVVNRFGSGRAYLLNRFLFQYPQDRLEGRNRPALDDMAAVLKDAGLSPKASISLGNGEPVAGCPAYLFNNGTTRLLGLVPDKDGDSVRKIRVRLESPGTVYDVRKKAFVATGSEFETDIEPAVPRLFAIVKEPIAGLEAKGGGTWTAGEEVAAEFQVTGVPDLRSVAKVEVFDPAGKPVRYYSGNEDIQNGKGRTQIRTALSDPRGEWRIVVTEVLSGKRAVVPFILK
jgi:hypothetical protein